MSHIPGPGVTFHFAQNTIYNPDKISLQESFRFASLVSKFRMTLEEYQEAKELFRRSGSGSTVFVGYFEKNG